MNPEDAEEYTQALGQVVMAGWRQAALGERLGVPKALGLTTREWVTDRLGGYLKLSVPERREAVTELNDEGMSQRQIGAVLGVDHKTVSNDLRAGEFSPLEGEEPEPAELVDQEVFRQGAHAICPTCNGSGVVPIETIGGVTR